jgi:hypothetical protein
MKTKTSEPVYFIEQEQLEKLGKICIELHSGSDAMRDLGHRLWLVCADIANQELPEELK